MAGTRRVYLAAAGFVAAGFLSTAAGASTLLSAEPPGGTLRAGETALVDDGSCPAGQIKEVTGGSNLSLHTGQKRPGVGRTRRCVKRP